MSRVLARALAIGVLVVSVAAIAGTAVINASIFDRIPAGEIVVVGDPNAPRMQEIIEELEERVADGDTLRPSGSFWVVVLLCVLLLWIATGALIVSKRPNHWAGWLFIITGLAFPILTLAQAVVLLGLRAGGSVPFVGAWATVGEFALYPVALIPLLFLLYPDGRVPTPRWRWVAVALVGGTAIAFLAFVLRPGPLNNWVESGIVYENPLGLDAFSFAGAVIAIGAIAALVAAVATVFAVRQRFKRSTGEERQQMRVLAFVASMAGVFFLLQWIIAIGGTLLGIETAGNGEGLYGIFFALTAFTLVIGIPVAYLVAIFRYRLWDLDVVIKKTLVFGIVASALTLLGVLVLVLLSVATVGVTPAQSATLALGVVLGLAFGPARRLARRLADRIVYRKRATPYEVLTTFSERLGDTYSTEDVLPRMVQVLASGTGATSARALLRVGGDLREVARWPDEAVAGGEEHVVPVLYQGEDLGALAVAMPANDPMDPGKEKLVEDLAAQTGLVLRNVKLIEDLRASRQRLVAAQDEERRKLERNIHDGAQQQLVALQVKQRLAEGLVERDPAKAREMLSQLQAETATALEDLRDLARGIYPPLLADQGLAAAIQAQARKSPVPATVEPDGVGRYQQDVEAAVYFCTLEALNNVAKYSQASNVSVRLWHTDGHLSFSVTDDGRGFDPVAAGSGTGLQGMADRLEAIGGDLTIDSSPGSGTTLTGSVPTVELP
ncbi:MAG TPA: histidine kinase [Actinomycetota bacterium]